MNAKQQQQNTSEEPLTTSGKAVASLVCGIVSLFFIGIVFGPIAIILGMQARREIRESGGRSKGDGLALAGIIIGSVGVVCGIIFLIYMIMYFVAAAALHDHATEVFESNTGSSSFPVTTTFSDDFFRQTHNSNDDNVFITLTSYNNDDNFFPSTSNSNDDNFFSNFGGDDGNGFFGN